MLYTIESIVFTEKSAEFAWPKYDISRSLDDDITKMFVAHRHFSNVTWFDQLVLKVRSYVGLFRVTERF